MPPNVVRSGLLAPECDCGHDHDPELVHDHGQPLDGGAGGGGGGAAGAPAGPRWQGLAWGGYPTSRDKGLLGTVDDWLEDRRRLDGAEGLWRVEDNLYNLTTFVDNHPGGAEWLQLTKGTDITEAFFTHHVSAAAEAVLPKFLVRPAASPRNSPFTFRRDGFYMQLRARARKVLENTHKQVLHEAKGRSKLIVDSLAALALAACALAAHLGSLAVGTAAGLLLSLTATAAHNFFHQRHNWRRYYFEMSFMSSREWMVSHALSHHHFTNTLQDLEVTFFEPFVSFLPFPGKPLAVRYLSWLYCVAIYAGLGHGQFGKRVLSMSLQWSDALALVVPASMLLTGAPLLGVWLMWTWVLVVSSFYTAFQGLSAGHHHPDNYHEGDAPGTESDFGLMQLAATSYCSGLRGRESLLLVLTHFGDHRLHHFFPALDHAVLPLLQPALAETLARYALPDASLPSWEAFRGQYRQMARATPNPRPPPFAFAVPQ